MKPGIFSFEGRYNRKPFWLKNLLVSFSAFLAYISLMGLMLIDASVGGIATLIMTPIIVIVSAYAFTAIYVKRLHDLDKSGWMVLLLFVPFANMYLWVICGFFKGTQGANKYGPDSLVEDASNRSIAL